MKKDLKSGPDSGPDDAAAAELQQRRPTRPAGVLASLAVALDRVSEAAADIAYADAGVANPNSWRRCDKAIGSSWGRR
jgi:hypothetical protein